MPFTPRTDDLPACGGPDALAQGSRTPPRKGGDLVKRSASSLLMVPLIALFAFGLGCNTFDTETVSAPAATATASVMLTRRGSYVDPKLIGPDYKLERVNESEECAPDDPAKLPQECNGKYWRSLSVISRSRSGIRVSQQIKEHPRNTGAAEITENYIELSRDLAKDGDFQQITEWRGKALPSTGLTFRGVSAHDGQERIHLAMVKAPYLITITLWGYTGPEQTGELDNAALLGWRVMDMLSARVPDLLGGPIPNPDYWGNKYWRVQE